MNVEIATEGYTYNINESKTIQNELFKILYQTAKN